MPASIRRETGFEIPLRVAAPSVWHIAGMSNGKQPRIDVRGITPEFYDTLKCAAKRAQLSVSSYSRLAIAERMALDELGIAVLEHETRKQNV